MTARRPLIAGNWKMNTDRDVAVALAKSIVLRSQEESLAGCELVVAPPYPFLDAVVQSTGSSPVRVAGQDLFYEASGAWTGAVSASMLRSVGCSHVLIGHSERRLHFGETDETSGLRVQAALGAGLTAIVCVGETLEEREAGQTLDVVSRQLRAALGAVPVETPECFVLAYEPVWAIGTGRVATPEQAQEVHASLRRELEARSASSAETTRILYGGSVKPANAAELFAGEDVDGALVGGASLDAESFIAIARAALSNG